jgi:hypothetical protein
MVMIICNTHNYVHNHNENCPECARKSLDGPFRPLGYREPSIRKQMRKLEAFWSGKPDLEGQQWNVAERTLLNQLSAFLKEVGY